MKQLLTMLYLLCFGLVSFSQSNSQAIDISKPVVDTTSDVEGVFKPVEVSARFPGGWSEWKNFLKINLKYPGDAIQNNITGEVVVRFIVKKDGTLYNIKAIKGSKELCEEAERVIKKSPKWLPAPANGKFVERYFRQTIIFSLPTQQSSVSDTSRYFKVYTEARFPGGLSAWADFLGKNLIYPEDAIKKNISGKVVLQFMVNKDGKLSDIKAISGPEELRSEAERVMKLSPNWMPATQNGRFISSRMTQPIIFTL